MLAGLVTDARALDPNRLLSQYVSEQWLTESRFPGGAVNGITQTADGFLWIGTDTGLIRFDGLNALIEAMHQDKTDALRLLAGQ